MISNLDDTLTILSGKRAIHTPFSPLKNRRAPRLTSFRRQ
jgi:hypothetical protein